VDGVSSRFSPSEVYQYLFELQASGRTNMIDCCPFLVDRFQMTQAEATDVRQHYIRNYCELKRKYDPSFPVSPPSGRKQHILRLAREKDVAHMISFEPDSRDRKFSVYDRDDELCAEAHSLSFDTVFATIYMLDGSSSNHYMPLNDFLELYTH
jgi:hypothetical protein